ncbi:GNAT family N-acetyltransferase [Streptomyces sp. ME19-01-6]|nr:GNAT family N-acetyltransferase [Streptomyces sp. ME19-01-6]MDX3224880.1 GNAT family N-acetyltransferase [Streptomyces sp. ME19-01-6]
MNDEVRIRHIAERDWDDIAALESRVYTGLGLSEGRVALESRARVSPGTCRALEVGPRLAGYVLALPYPMYRYPELDRPEDTAFPSTNLHLHDLVIAENFRRQGLGRRLLGHLTASARTHGYEQISLVAVGGSATYWSARGFTAHQEVVPPDGYGPDVIYMSRAMPSGVSARGTSSHEELG